MSENTSLVVIGQQQIQQGGLGIDFKSKLFELKPATVNINQPNTQAEGAIRGHFRISETGDQYKEMFVTLLGMPQEERSFYTGEKGQLNRTIDNLMCFSRDLLRPDGKAKVPQALACGRVNPENGRWEDTCPKADWGPWRNYRDSHNGATDPKLIPPCESFYRALFIDTVYKMPLQMYIRSKSKGPFEKGMKELSRKFKMMQSQGLNPNIFNIRFKLSTEPVKNNNGTTSYILKLSDFKAITTEEAAEFGEVYLQYINRNRVSADRAAQAEADAQMDAAEEAINAEIAQPGTSTAPIEAEYVPDGDGTVTI